MPDLTILILTWNRLQFTKWQFESIEKYLDTSIDTEIIVGDAGSTDGTLDYVENHPLVDRVYHVEQGNIGINIRIGAKQATGEYLMISGNDKIFAPRWNTKAYHAFQQAEDHGFLFMAYEVPIARCQKSGKPIHLHDGYRLQPVHNFGGMTIQRTEALSQKSKVGQLGEVQGAYWSQWQPWVQSFRGKLCALQPTVGVLDIARIPQLPMDCRYNAYRLRDPFFDRFDANEIKELLYIYISNGWMRKHSWEAELYGD